ncbi:hypothetical protein ACIRLA_36590 [Streptomyces sp. NPDC102364]|uniref:hypothetical protein n=1 Tax=Streptomyces sp. NPDC102364 TaxID=3366161 RepID=UPI00381E4C45
MTNAPAAPPRRPLGPPAKPPGRHHRAGAPAGRARPGSKHRVLTGGRGIPLTVPLTGVAVCSRITSMPEVLASADMFGAG